MCFHFFCSFETILAIPTTFWSFRDTDTLINGTILSHMSPIHNQSLELKSQNQLKSQRDRYVSQINIFNMILFSICVCVCVSYILP